MTDIVDRIDAERAARAVDPMRLANPLLGEAKTEIERLRLVVKRHWNFAAFVHLWTNRDNVTDAERVSAIKNHPSLRQWMGEQSENTSTDLKDVQEP